TESGSDAIVPQAGVLRKPRHPGSSLRGARPDVVRRARRVPGLLPADRSESATPSDRAAPLVVDRLRLQPGRAALDRAHVARWTPAAGSRLLPRGSSGSPRARAAAPAGRVDRLAAAHAVRFDERRQVAGAAS